MLKQPFCQFQPDCYFIVYRVFNIITVIDCWNFSHLFWIYCSTWIVLERHNKYLFPLLVNERHREKTLLVWASPITQGHCGEIGTMSSSEKIMTSNRTIYKQDLYVYRPWMTARTDIQKVLSSSSSSQRWSSCTPRLTLAPVS